MIHVRVETPCRPTEDRGKVRSALTQLFPDLVIERDDEVISGAAGSLDRLRELIRNEKIRDTARGQLLAGRRGNATRVTLSKQAASLGRVNFAAPSPLGEILVEIESDDLASTIDFLAESTVRPAG